MQSQPSRRSGARKTPERESDQPRAESTLDESYRRVLDATALLVGQRFLDELVRHLASTLHVRYVLIAETAGDRRARSVAFWAGNMQAPPFEYDLAGTPCEAVVEGNASFYPSGVQQAFPSDYWLQDMGVASYLAVPCFGLNGTVTGHIAIMDTEPLDIGFAGESLLRTLATRVAGELERRHAERALRESEARFRLLADLAPDVIYRFDVARGVFDYVSPSARRATGYDADNFVRDPGLAVRIVHPDDRAIIQEILGAEDERDGICRWTKQDGEMRWAEFRNVPVRNDEGEIVALEGIVRDVTKRVELEDQLRSTEEYFRALIDALPDAIFRGTPEGIIIGFEPAEDLEPLLSGEDMIGKSVFDVFPDNIAEAIMRAIRETLRTGRLSELEMTLEARGEQRHYEARVLPCAGGTVMAIVRDVTSQRAAAYSITMPREPTKTMPRAQMRLVRENKYRLTPRELAVLQYIVEGAADKEIAEALGISAYTVNKHVANILSKMHVSSRTGAGVRALREGLLT